MSRPRIPLIILGGADRKAAELPPEVRDKHPLVGYKGVDIRIAGRPIVSELIERVVSSGAFEPIVVAGPERVYRKAGVGVPVVDTDAGFGENIRAGLEGIRRMNPASQVAITTCDILPEVAELKRQMDDYWSAAPYDLWYALVRAPHEPEEMGEFGWKPRYRVCPAPGEEPVQILPGHLCIFDPGALRLDFLYRLMDLGYRTRNRPIRYRRSYMVRQVAWRLLAQDLKHLLTLRVPNVTWSVMGTGVLAARKLRAGTITRQELENAVRRIFVTVKHRIRSPERRVSLPILEGLSLAEDIDTVEEARALGGNDPGK